MSEDIVARLRGVADTGSDIAFDAVVEIERLRAEVEALKQGQEACAVAMNMGADVIEGLKYNFTEAIRLMEPVVKEYAYWDGAVLSRDDARAIDDFVKRMREGTTVNGAT